ncbi:hypothetical protein EVG20_g4703 [Dentipellis fragilis]|uniref:Nuclear pore complex protein n=1 Tax=Dentipellis fragilis TaxID=205917 RepID=A0A4Y9YUX9_9AGAM|nr:hypothetical protein EVG20_g4703 [Dentipellis fragilis]
MSDAALYRSSAEVLSLAQSQGDDLYALLSPESGFAPRMRQICRDQLADLEESGEGYPDDVEVLRMESNTWDLLQALMPARKTADPPSPTPADLLAANPYTPSATLAQATLASSRTLTELVAVREWLHETAPNPALPEATTGYWKFTKHYIMQNLRRGKLDDDSVPSDLDPDAPQRTCRDLAGDDESHERSLCSTLYSYIRAGRLEDAVEISRHVHQPWRAASIRGSLLFQWRAISTEPGDEDFMEEDDYDDVWHGNKRRRLWKSTCTRAATNPRTTDLERALYASLAPSKETANSLDYNCRTWEDKLWATISILCEERQSQTLDHLGGGFWEGGIAAVENGVDPQAMDDEEYEEKWRKDVQDTLAGLVNAKVKDGPAGGHFFHIAQLSIILERTDSLLDDISTRIRTGVIASDDPEYPSMARFFAHLCLFLQMIDIPVPPLATQIILEAYLQVLESAGQRDLIAMYAGALGDNAVERYALFLTSLGLSADIEERRTALHRARDHGLDMARVAVVTAERTIDQVLTAVPGAEPDADALLLRSIEWTTFLETTYDTALEQANVILRHFLAEGRAHVGEQLLDSLPPELAAINDPEELATEYLHYRQFFSAWALLARVVECAALETPHMSRETRQAWLKDYKGLITQTGESIVKLLTTDWLILDDNTGDRRAHELTRVRQIYIPELILRLHTVLIESRDKIPENVKHALDLVNIVADSRYKLYEDFTERDGRKLEDYLAAVREAVLAGLENGGSDPFRAAA